MTAETFLRRPRRGDSAQGLDELAGEIELALLTAVRAERRACAAECSRRAELWEAPSDKPGVTDPMRLEAQHRENEARYLADAIATRT